MAGAFACHDSVNLSTHGIHASPHPASPTRGEIPSVMSSTLGSIVLLVLQHAEANMHELAHSGAQSAEFRLTPFEQSLVQGTHIGVMSNGHHGCHVEGRAQTRITT